MKTAEEICSLFSERLPLLGRVRPRSTNEIKGSNWFLGCETIDRGYTDYSAYKEYLCPLGIHTIRLQGGWAKTEKVKGVYDFGWMDEIVYDAVSRGLKPWIQTGYGNALYPGGGGVNLGAGMPLSSEAMEGYLNWVAALVTRYRNCVLDWEVWNEPNFGDNKINTPEITAEFNLRTAKVIRQLQPEARISALALGHIDLDYTERFFRYLHERDACNLFHNVTYHDYAYNPDSNHLNVFRFRQIVKRYAPHLIIRQGENGAPSVPNAGGALWQYDWSELSQAKWDLRRMLDNLGNDIQCSVFSIAEMQYRGAGPITKVNTKGLLQTDADNRVIRPKMAYRAVQHVTSIFDDSLERIDGTRFTHSLTQSDTDRYWLSTDRSVAVYGYRSKADGSRIYTLWQDDAIPGNDCVMLEPDLAIAGSGMREPVLVELISGSVYSLPVQKDGIIDRFAHVPVFDSPVAIAEKSLIPFL